MPTTDAYRCIAHPRWKNSFLHPSLLYLFESHIFCKERQPYKRKLASYETPDND